MIRGLMVIGACGYGLLDVVAVAGPNLSVLVRIALFMLATSIGALQLIWLERRGIRATVEADPAGIRVFNGLRTHFVPWVEVEGFERSSRPFLFAIKRSNGRPLPMAGLTPGSFGKVALQTEDLERLEGYWHRVASSKSAP